MERFEKSALILYNAFNKGALNQNICRACVVGNLLGHGNWIGSSNMSRFLTYVERFTRRPVHLNLHTPNTSGYTIEELSKIEGIFLDSFVGLLRTEEMSKDNQYKALMNVLEYLAELDGIKIPEVTIESFKSVLTN